MATDEARGSMLVVGGAAGAGASFNAVPGSAWFSVDRRFNPEEQLEREFACLMDTITEVAAVVDADVTVDVLQKASPASAPATHPVAVALARCIAEVVGVAPRFELCPAVLETRWYTELGIPAFAYGPGRLDVSHGPDEYVDEAAMRRCGAVYALLPGEILR